MVTVCLVTATVQILEATIKVCSKGIRIMKKFMAVDGIFETKIYIYFPVVVSSLDTQANTS